MRGRGGLVDRRGASLLGAHGTALLTPLVVVVVVVGHGVQQVGSFPQRLQAKAQTWLVKSILPS